MKKIQNGINMTPQLKARVQAAKQYIQRRYAKLIQMERDKKQNWQLLYQKMQALNLSAEEQAMIKQDILHKEASQLREQRNKPSFQDYESIKTIGRGAFGEVRLCRHRETDEPVAIKRMKKSHMIAKNKVIQAREEKEILSHSTTNPWIVQLKCSFQDEAYLYLVMEYVPGGDLMSLLIKKDIFTEEQTRFYIAETLLALESIHQMGYIHRDLKPDNVLIDGKGHIKLSDFGLCKYNEERPSRLDEGVKSVSRSSSPAITIRYPKQPHPRNRKLAYSAVGTPDYVAPQVQNKSGYTESADWWSLGVIMFEMMVGYPPFFSEDPSETWHKILNWKKYLVIPKEAKLCNTAQDLIRRLICDQKDRLGSGGAHEIKRHPFFNNLDWKKLRETKAPFVPALRRPFDSSYFDEFEMDPVGWSDSEKIQMKKQVKRDPLFIGYTFKGDMEESELVKALVDLDTFCPKFEPQQVAKDPFQRLNSANDMRRTVFKKDKGGDRAQKPEHKLQAHRQPLAKTVNCWMVNQPTSHNQNSPNNKPLKKPSVATNRRSQQASNKTNPIANRTAVKTPTTKLSLRAAKP